MRTDALRRVSASAGRDKISLHESADFVTLLQGSAKFVSAVVLLSVLFCIISPNAFALVSVSHMGYHLNEGKFVTVYTHAPGGTFVVKDAGGATVLSGTLAQARDFAGNPVNCQGNNPCLVGDFTALNASGTYTITATASTTESSHSFTISPTIFRDNIGIFDEFFDAQMQQGSTYHADFNTFSPLFAQMADGSYIMTPYQAATTMMRLGNAYRRNPQIFDARMITILKSHVAYLESLQDTVIADDPNGNIRLGQGYALNNIFVPGPTNLTTMQIYDSGGTPINQTFSVVSLCGGITDSIAQSACLTNAANIYKCQADEPCLNVSYIDRRGKVTGSTGGPAVARGWYYEWGCYPDMNIQQGTFNGQVNPCMIYNTSRDYPDSAVTLAGYTEVIPAIYSADPAAAQNIFNRAVVLQQYIKKNYNIPSDANAAAFFGTASFLLYDMTGNTQYLQDAYNVRTVVSQQLIADHVQGNEFYWQEYARHRNAITNSSLPYLVGNFDPAMIFANQISGDYYNGNDPLSISKSAERIYQVYRNGGYMNSRNQLAESIFAAKAVDLGTAPPYAAEIADSQIAWLTGNNGVEVDATSGNANLQSLSFIFGIGTFPQQFHSRLLMNTGYNAATGGKVIGMRDLGFQFKDATGAFFGLDGISNIMGSVFGGHGNLWHNEQQTQWMVPQTFKNGRTYIPGWINGAYNLPDGDDIYNYNDDRNNFLFTETEDDTIASAVEAFAYADARYNGATPLGVPSFTGIPPIPPTDPPMNTTNTTNTTSTNTSTNTTNIAFMNVASIPGGANVTFDGILVGKTPSQNYLSFNTTFGAHTLAINDGGYVTYTETDILNATSNTHTTQVALVPVSSGPITLSISGSPTGANVTLDGTQQGITPLNINVSAGMHTVLIQKKGFLDYTTTVNITGNDPLVPLPYALTDGSAPKVVGQPTLTNISVQNGSYTMLETSNASFTIQYDRPATVEWFVDGHLFATDLPNDAKRSTFFWYPTILYVGNQVKDATVTAVANGQTNTTFNIQVMDVINPFWQEPETIAHAFVKNWLNAAKVQMVLEDGSDQRTVDLGHDTGGVGPVDTDWKYTLADPAPGNTYIRQVIVTDKTNKTTSYVVDVDLAHYRQQDFGSSGGGGYYPTSYAASIPPQFIYTAFSRDVIRKNESVDLTVDAKDDQEVRSVIAILVDDQNNTEQIPLTLSAGTLGYGTWAATLSRESVGKHALSQVIITDNSGLNTTEAITDRAFYVAGDTVLSSEHLLLVYALLDKSVIHSGEQVAVRLDARDYLGVTGVTATLKSKDGELPVVLRLKSGTPQYGTWEGNITLNTPDTTYALTSVEMTNGNETREQRVYGQKVYVNYEQPKQLLSDTTQGHMSAADIIKQPVTPLVIGLAGMAIAMVIVSSMTLVKKE